MTIDQNAGAGATTEGAAGATHAEDPGQGPAGILTGKTAAGAPATPPLAEGGTTDGTPPGWTAALTAEQKADTELLKELAAKFPKGTPELVQHYVQSKAKSGVTVPNEKATDAERAAYRKAIGVPEKPTDYKLVPGKVPAGFEYPDALLTELRDVALKAELSQKQTETVFAFIQQSRLKEARMAAEAVKGTIEQTTQQLKTQWKGDYDLEIGYMERGAQHYFQKFPGLADKFSRTGLANDPEVIRMFADLGRRVGEHGFVEGQAGGSNSAPVGNRTTDELAEKLYGKDKQ